VLYNQQRYFSLVLQVGIPNLLPIFVYQADDSYFLLPNLEICIFLTSLARYSEG
jgi:hypothetical protein